MPSFGNQSLTQKPRTEHLKHPSGFAHRATTDIDITWRDYLIPKSATVIGNRWYVPRSVAPSCIELVLFFRRLPMTRKSSRIQKSCGMTCVSARSASAAGKTVSICTRSCLFDTATLRICPGLHVAQIGLRLSEHPAKPIDSFAFSVTANMHAMPFELAFEARFPGAEIRGLLCTASLAGVLT